MRGQRSAFGGTAVGIIRHECLPLGLNDLHGALLRYVFIPVLDGVRPGGRGRELCCGIGIPASIFLFLLKVDLVCHILRCILAILVNAVF